ncbi:MAG: tetratricopeptide repeat protein, partial [Kiritimatiellaceae bacterium]|nr:tetratricopeptide repeat protein [Kiritimatiellaceae bacterium]
MGIVRFIHAVVLKKYRQFIMQGNLSKRHRMVKVLRLAVPCLCLFAVLDVHAQVSKMGATELLAEADLYLKTEQYDKALPYLEAYLSKFGSNDDFRIVAMSQDVRYKIGSIKVHQKKPVEAVKYFEEYVKYRPAEKWHKAMIQLTSNLLESKQFEACITNSLAAIAGPTNALVEVLTVLTKDQEKAIEKALRRGEPVLEYDEYGEVIVKTDVSDDVSDASGFSRKDLVLLHTALGESYSSLSNKVEESISPFLYVAEHETDSIRRGYAIMKVMDAMVDLQKFDALIQLIPALYQTDSRYDIRVNIALMKAASGLYEAKKYDEALPVYRMILPRTELIDHQAIRIKKLQYDAGIISIHELTPEEATQLGVKQTLMGSGTDVITEEWFHERGEENIVKPQELIELETLIDRVLNLPPYEKQVVFRNAELYDDVDRPWESFRLFDGLYQEDPEDLMGQRAFYESTRILFQKLDGGEECVQRCYDYLDQYKEDLTPRQIAYLLTGYYQEQNQMAVIKKILPYLQGFVPSDKRVILQYEAELYYMQAIADLVLLKYEDAQVGFKFVLEKYPDSHQEDNASYWHAMTLMFLQKYEEAFPEFEAYLTKFPEGAWLASANFQIGTCLFGMERYDEAKERFTTVIEKYPGSAPYPDACSMRGDILASEDGETSLEDAIVDYRNAISAANAASGEFLERALKQSGYATFQLAALYEAWKKYDEVLTVVTEYMDFYGADANIAKGIYWIGKTQINQGHVDEAVKSYLDAIVLYGEDLKQDGVDSMIDGLVGVARRRLKDNARTQLRQKIQKALQDTDNLTLQLRLRATIAEMDETEVELGTALIKELDDLSAAAPPVLSAICKASFELKDYSRAEEILKVFLEQFDESEFIRPAYKLRAYDLNASGQFDEALEI